MPTFKLLMNILIIIILVP